MNLFLSYLTIPCLPFLKVPTWAREAQHGSARLGPQQEDGKDEWSGPQDAQWSSKALRAPSLLKQRAKTQESTAEQSWFGVQSAELLCRARAVLENRRWEEGAGGAESPSGQGALATQGRSVPRQCPANKGSYLRVTAESLATIIENWNCSSLSPGGGQWCCPCLLGFLLGCLQAPGGLWVLLHTP